MDQWREQSKCKGPEAANALAYLRHSKQTSIHKAKIEGYQLTDGLET